MKIGISLSGISYGTGTTHRNRDFRNTYENFFEMLYNPLAEHHEVSVYTTTYPHEFKDKLLEIYKPVKYQFLPLEGSHQRATYMHSLCLVEEEPLDILICTRFDIWFKKKISELPVNYDKFNFLFKEKGMWNSHKFVTDNLFIFPMKYFYDFADALQKLHTEDLYPNHKFMHHIYQYVVKRIGETNISFISPQEQEFSHDNTFYDLKRIES